MKTKLLLKSGKRKGQERVLADGIYLVGRSKSCQIRPKNRNVSRKHCAIINRKNSLYIQDIGSKTGTFVNGERIALNEPIKISSGDRLQVGHTRFEFQLESRRQKRRKKSTRQNAKSTRHREVVGSPRSADVAVEHMLDNAAGEIALLDANSDDSSPGGIEQSHDSQVDVLNPQENLTPRRSATTRSRPATNNGSAHKAESQGSETPKSNAASREPSAEDILQLLEDEDQDNHGTEFTFAPANEPAAVNLDDDSDSDVDFLAPASGEEVAENEQIPSYQLRQDWDVQGVHKWVSNGNSKPAPVSAPAAKAVFKPKNKQAWSLPGGDLIASLDGDIAKIFGILVGFAAFASWIAYNIYLLVSFDG